MTYLSNSRFLDSDNSTDVPINALSSFTGTASDCEAGASIQCFCLTDQEGELTIEFSQDGTNWDASETYAITANEFLEVVVNAKGSFFRTVVDNTSVSNQTFIRMQSIVCPEQKVTIFKKHDSFYPVPAQVITESSPVLDGEDNLKIRGPVTTDELSIRDDFQGVSLSADWVQSVSSGSISVANSVLDIGSGTANASNPSVIQEGDYGPLTFRAYLSASQRIANQNIYFGLMYRVAGVLQWGAYFKMTGTDDTKVQCISQSSTNVNDLESTEITLFNNLTTSTKHFYKIDVSNNTVTFLVRTNGAVNYAVVAQHDLHIPGPYDQLDIEFSIENTAIVTNTTLSCDLVFVNNMNRVQIDDDFGGENIPIIINQVKTDYFESAANRELDGIKTYNLYGVNPSIGSSVSADIWGGPATTFTVLTTAVQHNIASSVAADSAAGTGARTVLITGLDANYKEISETVTMNGTTPVLTTKSYLFIISKEAQTWGTGGTNAGNITATSTGAVVAVQSFMAIGDNISSGAFFMVPAGYVAFVHMTFAGFVNANNNANCPISLWERPFGKQLKKRDTIPLSASANNSVQREHKPPMVFAEKTFIKFRAVNSTAGTQAFAYMGIVLQQIP